MTVDVKRRPLYRSEPARVATFGDIAAGVGRDLGLTPDPEQRWLLDAIYGETEEGRPAAYEVCAIAPRQNLKSAALEVAALTDLFVVGVDLAVWTAHEFKTARKSFEDMRRRIRRNPDYDARAKFRDSHGEEAIYLDTGERLEFHARSGGSGRGFTCSRLTLDEAMYLQPGDLGALVPTMFTIADAQLRYASSAGKATSAVLRSLRTRGRACGDPSLAYVEYAASRRECGSALCMHAVGTIGCALDDRELWWQANCALWAGRATEESVARQRLALPPEEFMREFLGWWDEPEDEISVIDPSVWAAAGKDPDVGRLAPVAFGVTVAPDRSRAWVGVAGRRGDGLAQVEVVEERPGIDWVGPWVVERAGRWDPCAVVLDGTALSLVPDLELAGVEPMATTSRERAQATVGMFDAVAAGRVRHTGDPRLASAVAAARKRPMGDAWVWEGPGVGPFVAVTLALYGLTLHGADRLPSPGPVLDPTGGTPTETSDLMHVGF